MQLLVHKTCRSQYQGIFQKAKEQQNCIAMKKMMIATLALMSVAFTTLEAQRKTPGQEAVSSDVVESLPRFPGCEDEADEKIKKSCAERKMAEFISQNITYPPKAFKKGIQGKPVVSFTVEKDGTLSNIKVLREIGGGCGKEAARVIQLMNDRGMRWIPGMQNGKPVRVTYSLPIGFKLQ